jgi:teichoic acid transport system ATP-binding protein
MDEFFGGVGDENFKKKSKKVFKERFLNGRTIIHVSHKMSTISKYCDRVLLMNEGEAVCIGKPDEVIPRYLEIMEKRDQRIR